MMKLTIALMMLTISLAQATEIKLYDRTAHWTLPQLLTVKFAVNEDLNRAWVEIKKSTNGADSELESDIERIKVEGLSFDNQSGSINLAIDGQIVECANLVEKGRWIFREKVLIETGRCQFLKKLVSVEKDDGFELVKERRTQVFLSVE